MTVQRVVWAAAFATCLLDGAAGQAQERSTRTLRAIRQRLRAAWAETGLALTFGLDAGVGLRGTVELGYVKAPRDGRHGAFAAGALNVGWLRGRRWTASRHPELRGIEDSRGVVGRRDPIFGDRVTIPTPVLAPSASRKGGLGLSIHVPLLPLMGLVRVTATCYVANPRLCRISNKLLDGFEGMKRRLAPLGRPVRRVTRRLRRRVNALRSRARRDRETTHRRKR